MWEQKEGADFIEGGGRGGGREGGYICIVYKGETGDTKAEKQEWKEISRLYDGPAIIVIDC